MDEQEFRRVLDCFPIVRSRDYQLDLHLPKESTSRSATDEISEWKNAWSEEEKIETEIRDIDHDDPFWKKLKVAAERKVGAAEAERFCNAFRSVHNKLVLEQLGKGAARSFNLTSLD